MKRFALCVILLAAASIALSGQRLLVYSEFQRVKPDGEVVAADRVDHRREILSPAVIRNAYTTLRVVVEAPPGKPYHLYVGQNPDDTVQCTLYQEEYSRVGNEWVPDKVRMVMLPHSAVLGTDQKVQTYLLDVWVPESTPAARFRLEVQLNVGDRWIIYPMEVRVMKETGPGHMQPPDEPPPVDPPPPVPPPPEPPPAAGSPSTAARAFRIPRPYISAGTFGVAVSRIRSTAACPRTSRDTSSAATPATCGVACEVPAITS